MRSLNLKLQDPANRSVKLRRQHRAALAAGLVSALRGASQPVRLVLRRKTMPEPECHDYRATDLGQDGADELCWALRQLGREGRLAELLLQDVLVSEALFRDFEGDTWPAMR